MALVGSIIAVGSTIVIGSSVEIGISVTSTVCSKLHPDNNNPKTKPQKIFLIIEYFKIAPNENFRYLLFF